jgi:hypothetical protein
VWTEAFFATASLVYMGDHLSVKLAELLSIAGNASITHIGPGVTFADLIGVARSGRLIGVTGFGIFLTPVFYYAVMRLADPGVAAPSAEKATENVADATGDGSDRKKSAVEEPSPEATGTLGNVVSQ